MQYGPAMSPVRSRTRAGQHHGAVSEVRAADGRRAWRHRRRRLGLEQPALEQLDDLLADPLHHAQVLRGDLVRVTGGHGSGHHRQKSLALDRDRIGDQREEVARDQARHGPDHDVDVVRSGAVDDRSMERGEPGEVLGLGGGGQLGDDLRQSLDQCAVAERRSARLAANP